MGKIVIRFVRVKFLAVRNAVIVSVCQIGTRPKGGFLDLSQAITILVIPQGILVGKNRAPGTSNVWNCCVPPAFEVVNGLSAVFSCLTAITQSVETRRGAASADLGRDTRAQGLEDCGVVVAVDEYFKATGGGHQFGHVWVGGWVVDCVQNHSVSLHPRNHISAGLKRAAVAVFRVLNRRIGHQNQNRRGIGAKAIGGKLITIQRYRDATEAVFRPVATALQGKRSQPAVKKFLGRAVEACTIGGRVPEPTTGQGVAVADATDEYVQIARFQFGDKCCHVGLDPGDRPAHTAGNINHKD